jgi:hypothetical protein
MFYVYTDSYRYRHYDSLLILKADIKQLNYNFTGPGIFDNVIINRFTIINRNTVPWNNVYITIWSDDDVGDPSDDFTGCDTNLQLGYTYSGLNYDTAYGPSAPAVSFCLLKGPSVYTGNNNDTDFVCNGKSKLKRTGYKQLEMSVFNNYTAYEEPYNIREQYHYMAGYDLEGNVRINPLTNQPTKFIYSGDPETGQGWVQTNYDDQRILLSMGPLTMNPGDTQVIVAAQIIERGTSHLNSVTVIKEYAEVVRAAYSNCFSEVPISVGSISQNAFKFSLAQNYPNPFNPVTKIKFSIPAALSTGEGSGVRLLVYDILGREVATLVNSTLKPGNYEVDFNGSNYASGIYFYQLTAGEFTETKRMVLIK